MDKIQEIELSELDQGIWALIWDKGVLAINLTYSEALEWMSEW